MKEDIKGSAALETDVAAELSVRLVVADHCMSRPVPGIDLVYSEFRGSEIKQVPVLRIFGPTPDGRKACVHIHGVFPYFYIPCGVPNPQPQLLYQIAASLDKALNISLKQANSTIQHVYRITLVKGLPFYGFHYKEHLFFKIFLYSPNLIKQAVDLLQNGAILGQVFQPYEAHLNFTLQFFIDFNLFGMSNVDLQTVKYRRRGVSDVSSSGDFLADSGEIVKPESMCYYEADALASHIINRQRIGRGDGIENPGLEEVWNQEKERRRQLNMTLASKSLTQERNTHETESHYKFESLFWKKFSNGLEKPVEITPPLAESIYYPAESLEGSQFINASDVSIHHPCDSILEQTSDSVRRDADDTIVDENAALDCSIAEHYANITLDSADMDFIELLKDMEQPVDADSVLGTQSEVQEDCEDADDAEYSQIFNDTMIINEMESEESKNMEDVEQHEDSDRINWQDSFWEGVNIPQLDGTFDDEHTKKVRKRKLPRMRSVGLPHPKAKHKLQLPKLQEVQSTIVVNSEISSKMDAIQSADIPFSKKLQKNREKFTENDLSSTLLKNSGDHENINCKDSKQTCNLSKPILIELVSKNIEKSVLYDIQNKYEPVAGPSNDVKQTKKDCENIMHCSLDSDFDHIPEENCDDIINCSLDSETDKEIKHFYNLSEKLKVSTENVRCEIEKSKHNIELKTEKESPVKSHQSDSTHIRLHHTSSTVKTLSSQENISQENKINIIISPKFRPPTRKCIEASMHLYNIPQINHPKPFYSNHKDVGNKIEVGQLVLKLSSNAVHHQRPFGNIEGVTGIEEWRKYIFMESNAVSQDISDAGVLKCLLSGNKKCILESVKKPPSSKEVRDWIQSRINPTKPSKQIVSVLEQVEVNKALDELDNSQAIGLDTEEINNSCSPEDVVEIDNSNINQSIQLSMQPDGSFLCFGGGSKQNDSQPLDTPTVEKDFLTIMSIEIHAEVRGDLFPDPQFDAMLAVFVSVTNDSPPEHFLPRNITEMYVVDVDTNRPTERCGMPISVTHVNDEKSLIQNIVEAVRKWDPDIMCAYEIELNSWGYLLERAEALGVELVQDLSRITEKHRQRKWRSDNNSYEGKIIGRVVFNVWRMLRHELALSSYSFENAMYNILKERVPSYSPAALAMWWRHESALLRWIPVEHYLTRLSGTMRILEKLDMINRTSELARLFGMQWWEVLSRGSQFRVESLMLRAARPLNLVALSPSVRQRSRMRAPECLPLIFEPESRYYADPVIVLDFQSLYPSVMIAYNYCFSTCIGRVQNICGEQSYEFGAWRLRIPRSKLETLVKKELVHWSPVGCGFVSPAVRRGVLPALLRRILAARQAVKKTMKAQTDEAVKKAMHSRQLGLKLIANVTYGYTAAHFSGRMPCVEVGDSVVAKGRETLERAIQLVQNNKQWNVKVVYGDTDSLFVLVPGASRERAFVIGQEIADAVTADNPAPVALKLEKVYQPCILQTKKRYVGYMYESAEQATPVYEAKGIETVRRDGCPAAVKLLQRCLCELFDTQDMTRVKSLVVTALSRLTDGRLPMHELLFTREYNGPNAYKPGAFAPPFEIARRLGARDQRRVPRAGERVSWAVCAGAPGLPLVRLARTPAEILADPGARAHAAYYATRVILPPLRRCLALVAGDVFAWYQSISLRPESGVGGIVQYMRRSRCVACDGRAARVVCAACVARPHRVVCTVTVKLHNERTKVENARIVCRSCCGHSSPEYCNNSECPVLWKRQALDQQLQQVQDIAQALPADLRSPELDF